MLEVKSEYMKNRTKNFAKFVSVRSRLDEFCYDDFAVIIEKYLYPVERVE